MQTVEQHAEISVPKAFIGPGQNNNMELYYVFIVSAIFSWAISAPLIQKGMSTADTHFNIP